MGRMATDDRSGPTQTAAERRGLWRLMLRLPSMRGNLQILAATSSPLAGLCEAYEDASTTRDSLQKQGDEADPLLVAEYEALCIEIESDVIKYCLSHPLSVLK